MEWIIIIGYGVALSVICIFSMEQLHLAFLYKRSKTAIKPALTQGTLPSVTIQLPVFNERYVVERLIQSVSALDYPKDKLEIQVLDDSTDETRDLVSQRVKFYQQTGVDIKHIHRENRIGYKAGALHHGLQSAAGELIAIFDADFIPDPDFLKETVNHFEDGVGMVQTRWGHLNQDYSVLTRVQAFGLNAHFTVEQQGRNASGKFMNFNGTAGIWRKQCILDAGGWQHDTLTEDLDLSYRAQLKGWKFKYLESVSSPAELPVLVPAIKSQQYRWNKGAAETAKKNLGKIFRSNLRLPIKLHAALHLLNSSVFLFLLIASVLSVPMLYIKAARPDLEILFNLASLFIVGFMAMGIFYWVADKASSKKFSVWSYVVNFSLFLTFSLGLALHNAIAVLEGYLGIKSPFIRTPKFNILTKKDSWKGNIYLKQKVSFVTLLEGALAVYFAFGLYSAVHLHDYGLILFHAMLTVGFGAVFMLTLKPVSVNARTI